MISLEGKDLINLNTEKYVNWILSYAPTKDKENFPYWVELSLKQEKSFFEIYDTSPLPIEIIQGEETERIAKQIDKLYWEVFDCLVTNYLTKQYYELATLIGKIDYLKWLNAKEKPLIQNFSPMDIVILQIYWLDHFGTKSITNPVSLKWWATEYGVPLTGLRNKKYEMPTTRMTMNNKVSSGLLSKAKLNYYYHSYSKILPVIKSIVGDSAYHKAIIDVNKIAKEIKKELIQLT